MQGLQRHLERAEIEGKTGRVAELEAELAMPPFPECLAYLWQAYLRLRRRTAGGFSGPSPIGWPDIDAFIRRTGARLAPWEIEMLERIDDLFVYRDRSAPTPTVASRTMTEDLFDALFK
mgnify:FL=1